MVQFTKILILSHQKKERYMKNSKKDAQYSVSAKICLAEALIALMEQTPLDSIKIQVLAKKAGVSRMSYYRYFSNKIEILEFYIEIGRAHV